MKVYNIKSQNLKMNVMKEKVKICCLQAAKNECICNIKADEYMNAIEEIQSSISPLIRQYKTKYGTKILREAILRTLISV